MARSQMFMPLELKGLAAFDIGVVKLDAILKQVRAEAGHAAGTILKDEWQVNIQNDAYLTGAYYESVEVEDPIDEVGGIVVMVSSNPDGLENPNYPYYLEFGTVKMSARPTMTPAFESKKDEAVAVAGEMIGKAVLAVSIV